MVRVFSLIFIRSLLWISTLFELIRRTLRFTRFTFARWKSLFVTFQSSSIRISSRIARTHQITSLVSRTIFSSISYFRRFLGVRPLESNAELLNKLIINKNLVQIVSFLPFFPEENVDKSEGFLRIKVELCHLLVEILLGPSSLVHSEIDRNMVENGASFFSSFEFLT